MLQSNLLKGAAGERADNAINGGARARMGSSWQGSSLMPWVRGEHYMQCDFGGLCGVLAIQVGVGGGSDLYPTAPRALGLWPDVAPFSTSQCVKPASEAVPADLPACMAVPTHGGDSKRKEHASAGGSEDWTEKARQALVHTWQTEGGCAGTTDFHDYYQQTCALAAWPLEAITEELEHGKGASEIATMLRFRGYPASDVDAKGIILLSACAEQRAPGSNAGYTWRLAPRDQFSRVCGGR